MAAAKNKKISDVPKSKVVTLPSKEPDRPIKYRCDFKSYDEYNKYKGVKG